MEIGFADTETVHAANKELLRLKFELDLGLRQIARTCGLGLGTVQDYLQRANAAGVS